LEDIIPTLASFFSLFGSTLFDTASFVGVATTFFRLTWLDSVLTLDFLIVGAGAGDAAFLLLVRLGTDNCDLALAGSTL